MRPRLTAPSKEIWAAPSLKVDKFIRPGPPEGEDDAGVVHGGCVVAGGRSHLWIVVAGPFAEVIVILVIL